MAVYLLFALELVPEGWDERAGKRGLSTGTGDDDGRTTARRVDDERRVAAGAAARLGCACELAVR